MRLAARSSPKPVPRRRRCRRRAASLVAVLALLAAFGCTDSPSPATPAGQADQWAAAAEAYLDAWEAANVIGFTNSAPFWTPDARVDMRELNGFEGTGRPAILQSYRDNIETPPRFFDGWDQADGGGITEPAGPIYLSRERAMQVAYIAAGPFLQGAYPVDQLVLLLDVGPEGGCPGPVAVFLDLDDQKRIIHEERFHRIDALRRCLPPEDRPTGWWDAARIPQTPDIRITSWVSATPYDIAIWSGDVRVDPIVEWARTRFASLGLPPPRPSSVTFLPPVEGDRWETFGFMTGSDAPDLGLPFTGPEACPEGPCRWSTVVRAATLHEFAHLWLTPKRYSGRASYDLPWKWKSETRITRFLEAHDLTWHDPNLPWGQQGGERAAETLTWGLMDQPYTVDARLGPLTCAELSADFQTLTTTTPDPRACAEPGGGSRGAR